MGKERKKRRKKQGLIIFKPIQTLNFVLFSNVQLTYSFFKLKITPPKRRRKQGLIIFKPIQTLNFVLFSNVQLTYSFLN